MELSDEPQRPQQPPVNDESGTTFTVNLGEVELSEDEVKAIMSDITKAAMGRASQLAGGAEAVMFGRFGQFGRFGRVIVVQ